MEVTWLTISLRTYTTYGHILWQEFVNIEGENKRRENEGGWACSLIISFMFQGETYEDTPNKDLLHVKHARKLLWARIKNLNEPEAIFDNVMTM